MCSGVRVYLALLKQINQYIQAGEVMVAPSVITGMNKSGQKSVAG